MSFELKRQDVKNRMDDLPVNMSAVNKNNYKQIARELEDIQALVSLMSIEVQAIQLEP